MLEFNACIDWVAYLIWEASSCPLSRSSFRFRLKVSTEAFVVQLPYIYQNKASLHSLLHTFESKLSVLCCSGGKCYFQVNRMRSC